jgi:hypothetical protein
MRQIWLVLLLTVAGSISLVAQTAVQTVSQTSTPPPPQSARQALIEMFLGKGDKDFEKHLPEAARQALIHKGETPDTSVVLRISTIGREMVAQGEHIETFDEGPTLLVNTQNEGHERIEVAVEHDSLLGEEDEIELSIHYYKDGQLQTLPVVPRLIFTFKQENEIWRLNEITAAAHVPLTDPDYLKELRKEQNEANETAARNRVSNIAGAETNYAAAHPDRGYACTLATLFPQTPVEEGAPSYPAEAANAESDGYRFALTGCVGTPASKFRVSAVPTDPDASQKTFCADESGTLKFVTGGKSSSCFGQGEPVFKPAPAAPVD